MTRQENENRKSARNAHDRKKRAQESESRMPKSISVAIVNDIEDAYAVFRKHNAEGCGVDLVKMAGELCTYTSLINLFIF